MSDILNTSANFVMRYLILGSITAAILIPLILLIIKAAHIRTPVYKHTIWLYCLIGIVLLPGLWLYAPKLSIAVLPAKVEIEDTIIDPEPISLIERSDIQEYDVEETPLVEHTPAVQSTNKAATTYQFPWRIILTGIWLIGFTFLLIRLIVGWYRLRVICKTATAAPQSEHLHKTNGREVLVLQTSKLKGPACFGIFNPLILLPNNIFQTTSLNDVNIVLAHELAHIERGDCWVNLFQRIVEAFFFFHPLVWIASRQLTQQREHICDNYVLAKGISPEDYTTFLSNIGRQVLKQISLPTVALFEGQLLPRVRNLLDPLRSSKTRLSIKATIVCTIIVSLVFIIIGCVRLTEKPVSQIKPTTTLTLPEAAEVGDFTEVKRLIDEGANINAKDENDITALQWAALTGNKDIAELLIASGADTSVRRKNGNTLLHQAARRGRNDVIELLITNGANLDAENNQGRTPLDLANQRNNNETVELLLKYGARGGRTIVMGMGSTSLHQAAAEGNIELTKSLIATDADINVKDARDQTPLHYAAQYNHKEIAELLLAEGANVNAIAQGAIGTPLHVASQQGHVELAELLIANGADVNIKTGSLGSYGSYTPLHLAADKGNRSIAELLIAKGADIHAEQSQGYTALLFAVSRGFTDVVELLIANRADVNHKDNRGITPLHLAAWNKKEIAELLIANGGNVNAKDNNGATPLFVIAGGAGGVDVAELLIASGADVYAKTESGKTPLSIAQDVGYIELVELLKQHGAKE